MKQTFMVYYWVQQGDRRRSICEQMAAESLDEATTMVQRRMEFPSFAFDSDRQARIILRTAHIQYIEIEAAENADLDDDDGGGGRSDDL
jgi:hypothetical protein